MRSLARLQAEVAQAESQLTSSKGRVLAAEARHDRARTAWGKARAQKVVLETLAEHKEAVRVYRAAQLDLALRRWDECSKEARRLHHLALDASAARKPPERVNAAWKAHEDAVDAVAHAAQLVEQWKPVP